MAKKLKTEALAKEQEEQPKQTQQPQRIGRRIKDFPEGNVTDSSAIIIDDEEYGTRKVYVNDLLKPLAKKFMNLEVVTDIKKLAVGNKVILEVYKTNVNTGIDSVTKIPLDLDMSNVETLVTTEND